MKLNLKRNNKAWPKVVVVGRMYCGCDVTEELNSSNEKAGLHQLHVVINILPYRSVQAINAIVETLTILY